MRAGDREVGKRKNVGKEPLEALTTDQIFILFGLKKVTSELVWPFAMRIEERGGDKKKERRTNDAREEKKAKEEDKNKDNQKTLCSNHLNW